MTENGSGRAFLHAPGIVGAELKYFWRELEPTPGAYVFRAVLDDLAFLQRHGKRLVLQFQDVSFDSSLAVPDYLLRDPAFGGGVAPEFDSPKDDTSRVVFAGWTAQRWNRAVHARFVALLDTLGRVLDGRIEALVRQHSLPLIAARSARVRAGLAVQDGNLAERDRATGKRVTVTGLAAFARDSLRLDYLF